MIRELLEKATGGEWIYDHSNYAITTPPHFSKWGPSSREEGIVHRVISTGTKEHDAALIVALHNCADELLRVREAAEKAASICPGSAGHDIASEHLLVALRALREKEEKL